MLHSEFAGPHRWHLHLYPMFTMYHIYYVSTSESKSCPYVPIHASLFIYELWFISDNSHGVVFDFLKQFFWRLSCNKVPANTFTGHLTVLLIGEPPYFVLFGPLKFYKILLDTPLRMVDLIEKPPYCKTLPVHLPEADCSIFTLSVGRRLLSRFVTINSTSTKPSIKVRNLTCYIFGESSWCWQPLGTC